MSFLRWSWPSNSSVITRSSKNWKANRPGGWDCLNIEKGIFPSSNSFGIPDLQDTPRLLLPFDGLVPFTEALNREPRGKEIIHFFLDDYRFERVWSRPSVYLNRLKKYHAVCTPDFSMFVGLPMAVNLWQTYRNRWLGCYWQSHGITVIPTINWTDDSSYGYCFAGVPAGSVVAIQTPDLRREDTRQRFISGLQEMIQRINPSLVISLGNIPECYGVKTMVFSNYTRFGG